MKPLTLYVSDSTYSSYQEVAKRTGVKAAALIREAMDYFLNEKLSRINTLKEWKPLDLGTVKNDWADASFRDEIMSDRGSF